MTGLESVASPVIEKGIEGQDTKGDAGKLSKEIGGVNDAAKLPKEMNGTKSDILYDRLSDAEKQLIKKETGWSDIIINSIENMDQYKIYKEAGLCEGVINGRLTLMKKIDMNYVDDKTGKTNKELMQQGRSPIDSKTGEKIELHHMGQGYNSPFAELAENSEHGDGNHSILHSKKSGSWRNNIEAKKSYELERAAYWKTRATEGVGL